jgi:hypothetical protein
MATRCRYGKLKHPTKGRRCKRKPGGAKGRKWSTARKMRYGKTQAARGTSRTAFAGHRRR